MTTNADSIIKELFQKSSLNEVTKEELLQFHITYPFSSIGSFLYAQKLKQDNDFQFRNAVSHTSLYFNNQRWLYYLLHEIGSLEFAHGQDFQRTEKTIDSAPLEEPKIDLAEPAVEQPSMAIPSEKGEIVAEPSLSQDEALLELSYKQYHTVDYFASQGIKLGQIDGADKLGQKVKTFTEWLKTMKTIQKEEARNQSIKQQPVGEATLEKAETDHNQQIILTETMAEVYQKQGLTDKAIEVYHKLSLQNPLNSHIFADRIKALKDKRP